jgi:hypothetical protein
MSIEPIRSRGLVLSTRTAVEAAQGALRDRLRELPTGPAEADPCRRRTGRRAPAAPSG